MPANSSETIIFSGFFNRFFEGDQDETVKSFIECSLMFSNVLSFSHDLKSVEKKIVDVANSILSSYGVTMRPDGNIVGNPSNTFIDLDILEQVAAEINRINYDEFLLPSRYEWHRVSVGPDGNEPTVLKTVARNSDGSTEATIWFSTCFDDGVSSSFAVWPVGDRVYSTANVWDWPMVERFVPRSEWPLGTGDREAGMIVGEGETRPDVAVGAAVTGLMCYMIDPWVFMYTK